MLAARRERGRRARKLRALRWGASAAAAAFVISLLVGFFWIRAERDRALWEGYFTKVGLAARKMEDTRVDKALELLESCPPAYRHWEWGRLQYLAHLDLLTFDAHRSRVEAVACSPGGRLAASGGWDGTIKVWSPQDGSERLSFQAHSDIVCDLAFGPDGNRLASASDDGTVKLWDAATGENLAVLEGHGDEVWQVTFTPDGQQLVSAGAGGTLRFWDVPSGGQAYTVKPQHGPITGSSPKK